MPQRRGEASHRVPSGGTRRVAEAGCPWCGVRVGGDRAEVAHAGAAVDLGVGVDQLGPLTGHGQAQLEVLVRTTGEVGDADDRRAVASPTG